MDEDNLKNLTLKDLIHKNAEILFNKRKLELDSTLPAFEVDKRFEEINFVTEDYFTF
jgi:hypothetical protein